MRRSGALCAAIAALSLCAALSASAVAEEEERDAGAASAEEAVVPPASETPPAAAAEAEGSVARAAFTTGIADREPMDHLTRVTNDVRELDFFTDLRDLEGHTVVHRWLYHGKVMAEVPFEVKGPRWRVHSSKRLDPSWTGDWTVSVVADGKELSSESFTYTGAAAPPEPAPAQARSTVEQAPPPAAAQEPPPGGLDEALPGDVE